MELNPDVLYRNSHRLVSQVSLDFKREVYDRINWQPRVIGIKGPKGVGKSTLLKQHIRETFPDDSRILYASLDHIWFNGNSLDDLVEYHYTHGGTHLFLDEVHKYKNWQWGVKNIYDNYPTMNVVFTGSSMLQIGEGNIDLSRRTSMNTVHGMSFREYLAFEGILSMDKISLEDILTRHVEIATEITGKVHVLPYFNAYLKYGYYPFYKEDIIGFNDRLAEVCRQVIEQDIPAVTEVEYATVQKMKKLLYIIASQVPFVPKMEDIYAELETSREQGLKLMDLLEDAALIGQLKTRVKAVKKMSSPDKLFLDNPNLMYALSESPEIGTVRETFFYNQLSRVCAVNFPDKGDFLVDDRYLFEVGGARKSFDQIKDVADSFLAIDGVEFGRGNKIPLWLFGFLY
ncbi:MAG: AAA family ATPase [Bacteroidales bacterium]|nr:AAA family ATPase [Bacteroidales bacterium]